MERQFGVIEELNVSYVTYFSLHDESDGKSHIGTGVVLGLQWLLFWLECCHHADVVVKLGEDVEDDVGEEVDEIEVGREVRQRSEAGVNKVVTGQR